MTCEELKDVYELYALGVLDGDEKALNASERMQSRATPGFSKNG